MGNIGVMIVDDEKLVIDDIIALFNWNENGFEVVATAINGKQALARFQEKRPKIIITDIRMPFMDGLELAKSIRTLDSRVKILLLTAFEDFEYAKQAIRLGISDYLIKGEVDQKTLCEKMTFLQSCILKEEKSAYLLLQKIISDLFNSQVAIPTEDVPSGEDVEELLRGKYRYALIEEDLPLPITKTKISKQEKSSRGDFLTFCSGLKDIHFYLFIGGLVVGNRTLLLFKDPISQLSGQKDAAVLEELFRKDAALIRDRISEHFGLSVSMFLLNKELPLREAARFFRVHQSRFLAKYLISRGQVYDFADSALDLSVSGVEVDEAFIAGSFNTGRDDELFTYIDSLFSEVTAKHMDYTGLIYISQSLYHFACHASPFSEEPPYDENCFLDVVGVHRWMLSTYHRLTKERDDLHGKATSVVRAMGFIRKHYGDMTLSIDIIASHVGLSSARMSVVFKQETGRTLNTVITDERMRKAKELLRSGYYKVYEIAEKVGYRSSQYFSQVFFRYTGMSPHEYRDGKKE